MKTTIQSAHDFVKDRYTPEKTFEMAVKICSTFGVRNDQVAPIFLLVALLTKLENDLNSPTVAAGFAKFLEELEKEAVH